MKKFTEGMLPLPPPESQKPVSVGTPHYSERLMRALELKGLLPNVLDPDLIPVVIAADFTQDEFKWLGRERRYIAGLSAAASVGNNQIYELIYGAPTGDTMCIVDAVEIYNREATAQTWAIYIAAAIIGGAGNNRIGITDGRSDGPGVPASPTTAVPAFAMSSLATFQGVQAIPANSTPIFEIPASSRVRIPGPWILCIQRFGVILRVHSQAVNVGSTVNFYFRERNMTTSEVS